MHTHTNKCGRNYRSNKTIYVNKHDRLILFTYVLCQSTFVRLSFRLVFSFARSFGVVDLGRSFTSRKTNAYHRLLKLLLLFSLIVSRIRSLLSFNSIKLLEFCYDICLFGVLFYLLQPSNLLILMFIYLVSPLENSHFQSVLHSIVCAASQKCVICKHGSHTGISIIYISPVSCKLIWNDMRKNKQLRPYRIGSMAS